MDAPLLAAGAGCGGTASAKSPQAPGPNPPCWCCGGQPVTIAEQRHSSSSLTLGPTVEVSAPPHADHGTTTAAAGSGSMSARSSCGALKRLREDRDERQDLHRQRQYRLQQEEGEEECCKQQQAVRAARTRPGALLSQRHQVAAACLRHATALTDEMREAVRSQKVKVLLLELAPLARARRLLQQRPAQLACSSSPPQ